VKARGRQLKSGWERRRPGGPCAPGTVVGVAWKRLAVSLCPVGEIPRGFLRSWRRARAGGRRARRIVEGQWLG
jgi:hypothetical protein